MQEKKSYLIKLSDELKKIDKDLEVLRAKTDQISESSKQELEKLINDLKQKKSNLEDKIKESHSSTAEAWEAIKGGLDSSYHEFSNAVKEAVSKFKN